MLSLGAFLLVPVASTFSADVVDTTERRALLFSSSSLVLSAAVESPSLFCVTTSIESSGLLASDSSTFSAWVVDTISLIALSTLSLSAADIKPSSVSVALEMLSLGVEESVLSTTSASVSETTDVTPDPPPPMTSFRWLHPASPKTTISLLSTSVSSSKPGQSACPPGFRVCVPSTKKKSPTFSSPSGTRCSLSPSPITP